MADIIGRQEEIRRIQSLYNSSHSEFLAIYGRRRVGKTFLVTQYFKDNFSFRHTGLSPYEDKVKITMKDQLQAFYYSLLRFGMDEGVPCPRDWQEAFFRLERLLEHRADGKKMVVFIDELPWMDTPRSKFVSAFEGFYNGWATDRDDILLIVCGSNSSWILKNIVNSKGGLYDRMTCEMKLVPFTLRETETYLQSRGIQMSRYDIVRIYQALGGVPYYLSYLQMGMSVEQNIDEILFREKAPLKGEFKRLFNTLFHNSGKYVDIVKALAKRNYGYTRDEISEMVKISAGGGLSSYLEKLVEADFVDQYSPVASGGSQDYYRLKDCFCIFYLKYLYGKKDLDEHFWRNSAGKPSTQSWIGIAFEQVCLSHLESIRRSLGINGIVTTASKLFVKGEGKKAGAQIDMVIRRADGNVNLCEMKFSREEYSLDYNEYSLLERRVESLRKSLKVKGTVFPTLVTTYGLKYNMYSGLFQNILTLDDLFN